MTSRPRLYIILGVVGCALTIVLRDSIAVVAVLLVAASVAGFKALQTLVRISDIRRRPAAFAVSGGGFHARLVFPQDVYVMFMLVLLGANVAILLHTFQDPDPAIHILAWVQLGLVTVMGALSVAFAVLAWSMGTSAVELTPEGVMARTLWDRRTIPWEALAPGGPPRPGPRNGRIRLAFARPELVRRGRFRVPGKGDWITAQLDVQPWLVADAIRWYVEHPEDRAAIGTEAEHARLLAALGAAEAAAR
ncbi:MAG TPA: hypothetical protein VFC19_26700 [Candidatus Limnocylindrales bacterium]|nr:hypothetical protein [Candidatus Limnocylindrales bacterium]